MPIYEYQCQSCGEGLEKLQKVNDAPLTDCPACGKPELVKLVSASSFRLKGTGWYETDFKNKGGGSTSVSAKDKASTSDKVEPSKTAEKTATASKENNTSTSTK